MIAATAPRPPPHAERGKPLPPPGDAPRAEWAAYYRSLGLALCAIPPGTKGPTMPGWPEHNLTPDHWEASPGDGIGAVLGASRMVSLDLDALPESRDLLGAMGLDLDALTAGACLVRGNPARLRALFRAPAGADLSRRALAWPPREPGGKPVTVFELRAGPVQDCLPPTMHPGTGNQYVWDRAPWELEGRLAELPPELLELWTGWDAWKPALVALCPWAPTAEPKPQGRGPDAGLSVIAVWNQSHDVRVILEAHGYRPKGKGRWVAPCSESKLPGVVLLPESGRIFSHHGADPLATGHALDCFEVFTLLEHGGDTRAAVRAAASALGMSATPRGKPQGESGPTPPPADDADPGPWCDPGDGGDTGETPRAEWPAPQELTAKVGPEPYPADALPETIRLAVEEVAGFVQAPVPLVAGSALAAVSVACQGFIDVQRAERLQGPVGLFLLSIAGSGERKSTCDGFFATAIRDWEVEQAEALAPDLERYKADLDAWDAERDGLLSAIKSATAKGKDTRCLKADLVRVQAQKPEAPRVPRALLGDETPENLAWSLARGWPAAGVLSSEAGLILGAHGMGRDSVLRNLGLLNVLWDGGTHSVGRRTSESFTVRGARLTVGLQVQEAALRDFLERTGALARGTGFLARFLLAWPTSTQGQRPFRDPPKTWPRLAAFHARLSRILREPAPIGDDGGLSPALMTLAPDAKRAWVAFHDAIEAELADGGELRDVRDVASKTADNAARLGALFHLFEGGTGPASLAVFDGASRIAAWHLSEARRFFGELALPTELADAARLDAWLIDYCRRERTYHGPTREAQRLGPVRDGKRLDTAMRELADLDRLRVSHEGRRRTIRLNPTLLEVAHAPV